MSQSSSSSSGIGFAGLLTVLFIGLKLTHYIDWSWFWVLSPMWISWSIVLGIFGVAAAAYGVLVLCEKSTKRSRKNAFKHPT